MILKKALVRCFAYLVVNCNLKNGTRTVAQ